MRRGLLALFIAFAWTFSTPANATTLITANTIQFSYVWGSHSQTFTDQLVTVTVTNDITNKIGYGGEVIDTYRITLGSQVIEVTEKHGPRDYTFEILGTQTLTLEGIDNGYWAGFYGPIMTVAASPLTPQLEPITQSPETQSATTSDATTSPPAEAQTQTTESPESVSAVVTPQPQPLPQPTPPAPEPSPSPEPSPQPATPEPTPEPTPTVSFPTQLPGPTRSPEATSSPVAEPTKSPTPEVQLPLTTTSPEALPPQTIEPTPVQSSEPTYEEPPTTAPQVTQIPEETFSDSVSGAIQAAVTQAIGAAVEAVGQLVEAFQTAGLDMTPEERKEAQQVVVSTVISSQVAIGIRKIK